MESHRYISLDTETTGLSPFNDRVCEIAAIEFNPITFEIIRKFHVYLNPEKHMPDRAYQIHGLSDSFLKDKPVFKNIAYRFIDFVAGANLYIHPLFGWLCDKWGTRRVLLLGSVLNIAWLLIFFPMPSTVSSAVIYFAAFGALFCLAAMWAPLAAHLPKMFPVEVRFTGAGVGFQAAGILGGAIAPTICVYLFNTWQSTVPVVLYLSALLVLAYICVYATKER